MHQPKVEVL